MEGPETAHTVEARGNMVPEGRHWKLTVCEERAESVGPGGGAAGVGDVGQA